MAGSVWVLHCYNHRVYCPAGWVASFSLHQGKAVLPAEVMQISVLYGEPRTRPLEMRVRAATAQTDREIQKTPEPKRMFVFLADLNSGGARDLRRYAATG